MSLFVSAANVAKTKFKTIIDGQLCECCCGLLFGKPYKTSDSNPHVVVDHCLKSTMAVSKEICMRFLKCGSVLCQIQAGISEISVCGGKDSHLILLVTGIPDIKFDCSPVELTDLTGHIFLPYESFLVFGFKVLGCSFYSRITYIKPLLFEIVVDIDLFHGLLLHPHETLVTV